MCCCVDCEIESKNLNLLGVSGVLLTSTRSKYYTDKHSTLK